MHRPIEAAKLNDSNDNDNPELYEAGLPVVAFNKYVLRKIYIFLSKNRFLG
jgi:hypothetical protein